MPQENTSPLKETLFVVTGIGSAKGLRKTNRAVSSLWRQRTERSVVENSDTSAPIAVQYRGTLLSSVHCAILAPSELFPDLSWLKQTRFLARDISVSSSGILQVVLSRTVFNASYAAEIEVSWRTSMTKSHFQYRVWKFAASNPDPGLMEWSF